MSRSLRRGMLALGAAVLLGGGGALPALADDYDPQEAGYPLRVAAYVVHPVGVIIDVLLMRPAHWFVSLPGLDEFFGHEPYDD